MNTNKSRAVIWVLVGLVIVVLFMIPRWTDATRSLVKEWKAEGVGCLPGHQNAALHIHPILKIVVDGKAESIPADIGIVRSCMAETHTHDASGTIHVESVKAGKTFTLAQFFSIWKKPIEREGFDVLMKVDGEEHVEMGNLILRDHQQIELIYTKKSS